MSISIKYIAYIITIFALVFPFSQSTFTTEFQSLLSNPRLAIGYFTTSNKTVVAATTSSLLVFSLIYILKINIPGISQIPQLINRAFMNMDSGYRYVSSNRSRFRSKKTREEKYAALNGGEVGGISNEGNTCFMNSVLQSLASCRELMKFIESYLYSEIQVSKEGIKNLTVKSNNPKEELPFTTALKTLFDNVNGTYGSRGKEFSTKPLLNRMPNGPKQNFFSGYNQEDAQEFYQLVMSLLESEYKKDLQLVTSIDEKETELNDRFVDSSSIKNIVTGCYELGKLGKVYVPASQVDPNVNEGSKVLPLDLITPVDGITVERIGCLSCGEVGGIRYSVNSGLSLNLPFSNSYYSNFNLNGLLDNWVVPEIIEDVNCNRCGLIQTRDFILKQIEGSSIEKIVHQFKDRLIRIEMELEKPNITDEVFESLTIKQMITKTKKSKQILLSRPPPLLSIHINRSVFDPTTYRIVKNSSNVSFPAVLDLSPYVAVPNDINMDARLPFRKQDVRFVKREFEGTPSELSTSESPSDNEDMETNSEEIETESTSNTDVNDETSAIPLSYNLKAVISHYGTHNYGHYICYRKLRGTWWRISDESVYVTTEEEVLTGQGAFMMFYEFDDGHRENLVDISAEEEQGEEEEEGAKDQDENETNSSEETQSKADSNESLHDSLSMNANFNSDAEYESSGLSDNNDGLSKEIEVTPSNDYSNFSNYDFNLGKKRAHF